jgi:TRAP-type C4-dicarboxylate transport system substrate-binding protein
MARGEKTVIAVFLFILFTVTLMSGLVQNVFSQEKAKQIKLTYALFQPGTAALSKKNTEFAKEIEKRTNGRVKITVHQGGSLISGPAMYQGVSSGIADMGNAFTLYNPGAFPFTQIVQAPAKGESGWAVSSAMYDFMMKYQPKEWQKVQLITTVGTGADFMMVGTGKKPIRKLEDWKGTSVRPADADIIVALGGTVKDLPMSEVYDAIAKGVVDGVTGTLEPLKAWRQADVCKYITVIGAPVQPSIMWFNFMNKKKWNSLPSNIQKTISEVGKEYSAKLGLTWDDQAVAGVEYAKSLGCSIYLLPKDEEKRWADAIAPVIDARLSGVVSKGFSRQEVDDAWNYFQSRLDYWNGQQTQNNITPTFARVEKIIDQ